MRPKLAISAEDSWLVRLFIWLRAAKGPVSAESIVAEFERREISGVTPARVRRLLRGLVEKGYLRETNRSGLTYAPTGLGRKAAEVIRSRLAELLRVTHDD